MIKAIPIRILGAALLLVVLLVGLVVVEDRARSSGREVAVPMEAVDPRDLLTGHYVALELTQRLAPRQPCPPVAAANTTGWVALDAQGRVKGSGATRDAALAAGGDIAVRGDVSCSARPVEGGEALAATLDIGVDRFHIDQTQAEAMETTLRDPRGGLAPPAFAVISVGDDGRARLKGVILDGKRTDLTWW